MNFSQLARHVGASSTYTLYFGRPAGGCLLVSVEQMGLCIGGLWRVDPARAICDRDVNKEVATKGHPSRGWNPGPMIWNRCLTYVLAVER